MNKIHILDDIKNDIGVKSTVVEIMAHFWPNVDDNYVPSYDEFVDAINQFCQPNDEGVYSIPYEKGWFPEEEPVFIDTIFANNSIRYSYLDLLVTTENYDDYEIRIVRNSFMGSFELRVYGVKDNSLDTLELFFPKDLSINLISAIAEAEKRLELEDLEARVATLRAELGDKNYDFEELNLAGAETNGQINFDQINISNDSRYDGSVQNVVHKIMSLFWNFSDERPPYDEFVEFINSTDIELGDPDLDLGVNFGEGPRKPKLVLPEGLAQELALAIERVN